MFQWEHSQEEVPPALTPMEELFEASYAAPANSICNAIHPVWYGTPPPAHDSPWATDA